jgi:hypothetical protein
LNPSRNIGQAIRSESIGWNDPLAQWHQALPLQAQATAALVFPLVLQARSARHLKHSPHWDHEQFFANTAMAIVGRPWRRSTHRI